MPRPLVPQADREWREDVLTYLASRYDHASGVLRDAQWDSFRAFVELWLDLFDWRSEDALRRYLALPGEQRQERFERFVRQAESWDVTFDFPVEDRPTPEARAREAWRAEYEQARARLDERFARATAAWERIREFLEAENQMRFMPVELREAWAALGLAPRSSLADARKRYRELAKQLHPDRTGSTVEMARVNDAWQRLQAFFHGR